MDSEFAIDIAFAVLFRIVKSPSRVRSFKAAFVKLRDKLNALPLDK